MRRKKPKLSEEVHRLPGDGFRAKATEAYTSHGRQTTLVPAPDQWQRCGEGFQFSNLKSGCDKTPKVKSLTQRTLQSYSAFGATSQEKETASPRAQRNFGQKWIQTEELFDGTVLGQNSEQRTIGSLSKSASRNKASLASNTMTIEDADIDSIRWSESESDSEDVEKPPDACISSSSIGYTKKLTRKAKPQTKNPTGRNLKPGADESSESGTGGVISASDSDEEQQRCIEAGEVPQLLSQKTPSPTLEIECVGSPERSPFVSSDESSHVILTEENASSHSSESSQKGKERDAVAKSNPDLYFNRAMSYKYQEEYQQALEGFHTASQLDPSWTDPGSEEKALLTYLDNVVILTDKRGKLKAKKLDAYLNSLGEKDLGPYAGGTYTSPHGKTIELAHIPTTDLAPEINSNKVICGKVVCSVESNSTVPFTFCLCDKKGCVAVTVYNMVQGGGVKIGDSVAIPEPFGQKVQVKHKDKTFDFLSVRVDSPLVMVVNGHKVRASKQAASVLSVRTVPE